VRQGGRRDRVVELTDLRVEPREQLEAGAFEALSHGPSNIWVPPNDRARLEQLCRYLLRPPLAQDRVRRRADGRILLTLKTVWRDGTAQLLFEPIEFMEKLAAIIPRPAVNLLIYHGALAPHARTRSQVVRCGRPAAAPTAPEVDASPRTPGAWTWRADAPGVRLDVLACPRCGGRLRVIAPRGPTENGRYAAYPPYPRSSGASITVAWHGSHAARLIEFVFGAAAGGSPTAPTVELRIEATGAGRFRLCRDAFAAGDMQRGQSLIVWAIAGGRCAARGVDQYLMGRSDLPAPLP
jgi:hypothetical protein